jgi:mRNA interferase MazF
MAKGKVVLVPFPFDDLRATKVRPAVCLNDPVGAHRHIVLAFITSRMPADVLGTDLIIGPNHPDFAQTGLRGASVIRLHRLVTVTSAVIRRQLGQLSQTLSAEVDVRLRALFAL